MRTILVIDDPESFGERLRTVLETRGFKAIVADNIGEGLALAACHEVDAVLMDHRMPHRNGLEFCRALRRQNTALDRQVPVWMMTAIHSVTVKEAMGAGAKGIFRKPFPATEIAKMIEQRLRRAPKSASIVR